MKENKSNSSIKQPIQIINTKGCCFLCLKIVDIKTEEDHTNEAITKTNKTVSIKCLQLYLKVNTKLLLPQNSSPAPPKDCEEDNGDSGEIKTDLCNSCARIVHKCSQLYQILEKTQLELNFWMEKIHSEITEASKTPELVQNYSKRMTSDPETLTQLVFVDNLRKEIAKKSLTIKPDLELKVYLRQQKNFDKYIKIKRECATALEPLEDDWICSEEVSYQDSQYQSPLLENEDRDDNDSDLITSGNDDHEEREEPMKTLDPVIKPELLHSSSLSIRPRLHLIKKHKCNICNIKVFANPWQLTRHKKICKSQTEKRISKQLAKARNPKKFRYKCSIPECGKRFIAKSRIEQHFKSVHLKERNFHCQICKKSFASSSNLNFHKKKFHLNRKDQIVQDQQIFSDTASVTVKQEKNEETSEAEVSPSPFQVVSISCAEMYLQDPETGAFHCSSCNKPFGSSCNVKLHYEAVHLNKRYPCEKCGGDFTQKASLIKHQAKTCNGRKRKPFSRDTPIERYTFNPETGIFSCANAKCSKTFESVSGAYQHYGSIHLKEKHPCESCNMVVCSSSNALKRHQKRCEATFKIRLNKKLAKEKNSA